jgi:ectoine hydroxylase-related dioxygenase (phytanoyl-CoA dioxygenase family)
MTHSLSEAEIQQYRTEGYVVVPRLFNSDELRRAGETIQEMTRNALAGGDHSKILELEPEKVDGEVVARRIYHPFHQHETFRGMATNPKVMDRIEALIGPDFGIQHSKLNMKPAKVGSVVDWHQDMAYFPHTNDDLVTTLVYLDDATEENGCLQVLPRHHHHYFNHTNPDGSFAGLIVEDLSEGRFGRPVPLPAPAGSVIFMHCILPHSSLPNRSPKPRRTLIFEYRAADSFPIYYADVPIQESKACHLRGKRATTARFGGPPPIVPQLNAELKSLYEMQLQAKKQRNS